MDLFGYFDEICRIPRESGNEEGMRQYLLDWASKNGIEAQRDKAGNIIARIPATKDFEDKPSVALQGHMDMVCVRVPGCEHDFTKDPIETYVDGDFLRAKGTSLGGDNGIGVAMAMAAFTDPDCKHGPLEAIFTFSEETGMDGAFNLDGSLVQSRRLINLDSEEEGVIYIGCAGGIDLVADKEFVLSDAPKGTKTLKINIEGLKGGHSGGEIHLQRLNAITAMARILMALDEKGISFRIMKFDGGTRRNVIPSTCKCVIQIDGDDCEKAFRIVLDVAQTLKEENRFEEPGLKVECVCDDCTTCSKKCPSLSVQDSLTIARTFFAIPHGVFAMSKALPGVVETSDNLAIARLIDGKLHIEVSVRSNIDSAKYFLVNRIYTIITAFGIPCRIGDGYPSWTPDPDSKLAKFCAKAYEDNTGKKAVVTAIHAGLECGVINSIVPGMDSVSLGPDLFDVHSTNEHFSISSVKRTYDFLKHLLSIIE